MELFLSLVHMFFGRFIRKILNMSAWRGGARGLARMRRAKLSIRLLLWSFCLSVGGRGVLWGAYPKMLAYPIYVKLSSGFQVWGNCGGGNVLNIKVIYFYEKKILFKKGKDLLRLGPVLGFPRLGGIKLCILRYLAAQVRWKPGTVNITKLADLVR